MICPLCLKRQTLEMIQGPDDRLYKLCKNCNLIFTEMRLTAPSASGNDNQQNKIAKNTRLMKEAAKTVKQLISEGAKGLCIGAGVKEDLKTQIKDAGMELDVLDTNYLPTEYSEQYDFVLAIGILEDFFFPAKEIKALTKLINENGKLIIVSEFWQNEAQFSRWTYAKEKSHVAFYHSLTFDYLCEKFGFEKVLTDEARIVVLQKKSEVQELAEQEQEQPMAEQ